MKEKNITDKLKKEDKEIKKKLREIQEITEKINQHQKNKPKEKKKQAKTKTSQINTAVFYLSYILIASAELSTLHDPWIGLTLHSAILLGLITSLAILHNQQNKTPTQHTQEYENTTMLLKALILLPLIRIFGYTMPLIYFRPIYWFLIISIPLLIAVITLTKNLKLTKKDIGLTGGQPTIQTTVILCGIALGFIEYLILKPQPLIDAPTPQNILISGTILMIFTGFTEELIFRGIIQTISTRLFGAVNGILYTAVIFTTMHIGFNSLPHMTFVLAVAIFYGYVFHKTKTLTGVIIAHGASNIILLLIAPFIL